VDADHHPVSEPLAPPQEDGVAHVRGVEGAEGQQQGLGGLGIHSISLNRSTSSPSASAVSGFTKGRGSSRLQACHTLPRSFLSSARSPEFMLVSGWVTSEPFRLTRW